MNETSKKLSFILGGIVILILIGIGIWVQKRPTLSPNDASGLPQNLAPYFVLTVMRNDIPDQKLDKYKLDMNEAKELVVGAPEFFDFRAYMQAASLKKAVADYDGARDIWLVVNEKRPQNSVSFGNLGDLYANFLKEPLKGEEMYIKAMQNDPTDSSYVRNLFELYQYQLPDKLASSEALFSEAVEKNETKADYYLILASYYELVKNKAKAISAWKKLKTAFKDDPAIQKQADEQIERLSAK